MSIRLILLIIGAIIVLGIIIDGVWRKRRQNSLRQHIYQQELPQPKASAYSEIDQPNEQLQAEINDLQPVVVCHEEPLPCVTGRIEPVLLDKNIPRVIEDKQQVVQQIIPKELIKNKLDAATPEVDDFIVLTVMAKPSQKFSGYELLQALLKAGLKHGEMKIFHRHRYLDNKSAIYFSVASVTKPGYFDIQNMHKCETKGLNLFMSVPDVTDPADVFEIMLATAQQLAEKLNGDICDRDRKVLTKEVLEAYRSRAKITGSIR